MDSVSSKIFEVPIAFKDFEYEKNCIEMIESLSEEQLEQAACTSYAYLKAASSPSPPSLEVRRKMALRMARRHLMAEEGSQEVALQKMKSTLEFRKEMKIDDLRQSYCDEQDILNNTAARGFVVCGYDVDDRAILLRFPKYDLSYTSKEGFFQLLYYNIERAIACTERKSLGEQEKIVVAVNLSKEERPSSMPPVSLYKNVSELFQSHYPERLHLYIVVEPPFLARALIKLVTPFLDPNTREKIMILSSEQEKENELESIIHEDQAMPFLRVNGKIASFESDNYLRNVPFDCAANE